MTRRVVPLLLLTSVLAGCGFYAGTEKATQPGVIGALHMTATFCATDASPAPTATATTQPDGTNVDPGAPCAQTGGVGVGPMSNAQALIAVRLPATLTAPATLTSADNAFTANANASYTAALTTANPPASGYAWHGYVVDPVNDQTRGTYTTSFELPLPATPGHPFQGPVKARVVAGYRYVDSVNEPAASDAFDCTNSSTTCIANPNPEVDFTYPTRDLAIAAPDATSTTDTVTFPVRFAGAAGPTFDYTATTTVPGGTATPADAHFTPTADQQATEPVTVTVPGTAPSGTYDVTLTATLGDQTRSATGQITVTQAGPTGPTGPSGPTGPKATATPSPSPKPVLTPAATATPAPRRPKVRPRRFTLRLKAIGPRAFKARGRLTRPAGVNRADGCHGRIRITAEAVRRTTPLTGLCTYSTTVRVGRSGSVKVGARFLGNGSLTPKAARARRFRAR